MNELQAEKKAIYNALDSIRANDNSPPDSSPNIAQQIVNPVDRRSRSASVNYSLSSPIFQSADQQQLSEPQPKIQPATQAAMPVSFPVQTNNLKRSPQGNPAVTVGGSNPAVRLPLQQLETQAKPINPLYQTQGTVLRRLQAIAAQIEQERCKNESYTKPSSPETNCIAQKLPLPPGPSISLPNVNQQQALPAIDNLPLNANERITVRIDAPIETSATAYATAQQLRLRQERREAQYQEQFVPRRKSRRRLPLLKRLQRWLLTSQSHHETTEAVPFTLRETLTLLLGAALTRLLLNLLLEAIPLLVIPITILLVTLAAIVVYRTKTSPGLGITWGYRFCIFLLGLLIGGKL